jgi:hypothetical protein
MCGQLHEQTLWRMKPEDLGQFGSAYAGFDQENSKAARLSQGQREIGGTGGLSLAVLRTGHQDGTWVILFGETSAQGPERCRTLGGILLQDRQVGID